VSLSWHIDTCVYLGKIFKIPSTYKSGAFATTYEQPFTLSQSGIGGLPRVRRCFWNEYRCAHVRPPSAGQTGATITMDLQTPQRLPSDTLHSRVVNSKHFLRLVVNFSAQTHFARNESHYEILVGRSLHSRFCPIIKLSTEEHLTDLRHLLPPNGT